LNGKGFDWNPPLGYDNTVYQVEKAELELLKNKKSKSDKLILHIHGGGYILPLSKNYRDISVELSKRSGEKAQIANLNYRVYPKTYPSALDDAFASWLWLLKNDYNPKNIIIVGDSAGGNLTLALTAKLRDEGYALPKAIICISACSDYTLAGDSFTYNLYKDPMFGLLKGQPPEDVVKKFSPVYPGKADTKDPYLSPLFGSLEGFPDMLLLVGTHEMLESDSINIHQKAISQGVNSKLIRYEGMFHSWQFFGDLIPESEAAWNDIEKFIQSQYKD
ncbi:MAG: alpha/beta hydrolase, partial [Oscillospiraceae bacterium]|nr:alpha/beta hydrolase [Oscillospiraceae bacterium]